MEKKLKSTKIRFYCKLPVYYVNIMLYLTVFRCYRHADLNQLASSVQEMKNKLSYLKKTASDVNKIKTVGTWMCIVQLICLFYRNYGILIPFTCLMCIVLFFGGGALVQRVWLFAKYSLVRLKKPFVIAIISLILSEL